MRVSFHWLKEFIDVPGAAADVAHRLTMIGLEVEAIEAVDDDWVFEVNVTPNRPDCLSIIGIVRELSAAYRIPYRLPDHDVMAETGELGFNADIIDPDLCHRYAGRVVRGLKIGPSPEWMRTRLEKCGIRAISNVVDVTNYVLLELGHPLHAFDLTTIRGSRMRIGTPKAVTGEKPRIKTIDGVEREMTADALLIWDSERPIAVAGIMGGLETEVSDSTTDVFIEAAHFEPISVRRTSKALGLKSESSYRFERGTDIKMLKKALDRAAYLMKEVAGGTIHGKIDIYPRGYKPSEIVVRYDKVNAILGTSLSREEITLCLGWLGLDISEHPDFVKVKPPTYRQDMKREIDVIEEVARIYGYERIKPELPKATIGMDGRSEGRRLREMKERIRQSLLRSGFTEAVNFSFMSPLDLDRLNITDERRNAVEIKNPLRAEDSLMRTTLIPALLNVMAHNVSHGNRDMRMFELSRVFFAQDAPLPDERERFALISYREKEKALYRDDTPDFFVIKGVVEAVLRDLKISGFSVRRSTEPFLHPGQSADIFIADEKIGFIGVLSPLVVDSLEVKANKPSIVVAEIDLNKVFPYAQQLVKYTAIPRYPSVDRDLAILLDASLEVAGIMEELSSYHTDLIEDVQVFDVYQGKGIAEGKKSIAFHIRYRSPERTLRDEEVDSLHSSLVSYILEKTGGELRQ
ncbi:MAG: phenylalanine--tRNA ligase subunit beta [Thermodesulfovibrionales bacterium]|jgi:phenylalanyl-tRNA synthetase beta chain